MASVTVRKIDDNTKRVLRLRAARNGNSLEQELRSLLMRTAEEEERLQSRKHDNLYDAIRELVDKHGGIELEIPPREGMREPPAFD